MTETVTAIDNPHAFPNIGNSAWSMPPTEGMTLRDWFAGQALAGIMARMEQSGFELGVEYTDWSCPAGDAYGIAEAMLAERKNYKLWSCYSHPSPSSSGGPTAPIGPS